MGGGGGTPNNSRSWEEDIYWTHFQFIRFTQFLQTTHLEQQLALPKTFSGNLKNKLPANVTLKGPSGVLWDIGLTTRDDTVYATNGWQQFVKDHSLKQNDFLVVKYNGESLFEVLIFHGESFCEKAASYFILERGQAHTEQGGRKAKDIDTSVEEVNTPSNGSVECGLPEKSWEEDIYWTHFQFIHFAQFLSTDFEQQLALPKTFSDNLKKKLPENVTLKGPSGVVWNIELTTEDDTVYFTNGWQRFVNDHSLKESDFLFFKYNGESLFEVLIFDGLSFCEKAASYFVGKCGHAQTEQGGIKAKDTNKSVEEINTTFDAGVESASPEKCMADAVTKTTPVAAPSQSTGKRIKKPVNKFTLVLGLPKAATSHKRAHDLVACNKEHSEASIVHRSGKEDVKKIAQSFTSSFPYFVKIFKTGDINVSRTMKIPYHFSAAHLPDCKTEVTLRNSRGECWTVNSIPYAKGRTVQTNTYAKRRPVHTFCGGWVAFVRDNNIKFGDTCIFELVSDYVMQVHISGVGKEGLDQQNGNGKLNSM